MSNIKAKINSKIDNLPDGAVFISNDFLELADYETIRKNLNRFVNDGTIQRIVNGVYYKPRFIEVIGEFESPSINEVAIAIARKYNWTIAPSGNTALNLLGLFQAIGKDNISEEQILYLKNRLTKSDKEKLLEEGKTTSAWIYKILKKIGES